MLSRQRSRCVPWVDTPPQPPGWYEAFRARCGQEHTFISLAPDIVGAFTHFNGERSVVCVGADNGCRFCPRKPLWEGWTLGLQESSRRIFLVAISAGALRNCFEYKQGLWCVGRRFTIGRAATSDNGRVWLSIGERVSYVDRLPKPHDLRECVSRMWGMASGAETDDVQGADDEQLRQIDAEIEASVAKEEGTP